MSNKKFTAMLSPRPRRTTQVSFTCTFYQYHTSGSVFSSSLGEKTMSELKRRQTEMVKKCLKDKNIEVVTFGPITKNITIQHAQGKYAQFQRITNPYMFGEKKPDGRFFTPL